MKYQNLLSVVAVGCTAGVCSVAGGSIFHEMQIEQVIGGVGGDSTAQAIQLRLREDGECIVSLARLIAHDAAGNNPVLLIDLQSNVPGCDLGDRVLITSENFADYTDQPLTADFTLTNLIPESYLAAGSVTFEGDDGDIYWRLSWGGTGYTGSNEGENTNDDDGDFGPPFKGPLPSSDDRALQFQRPPDGESTTNHDDYSLTDGPALFTNNAGESATVVASPKGCPHDLNGDDTVGILDLLALLAAWGTNPGGPPDFDGDGTVGILDLLALLAAWGDCP